MHITSDVWKAKEYLEAKEPCVLVLTEENSQEDLSFTKYLASLDEPGIELLRQGREDEVRSIIGEAYLSMVEARVKGLPLTISRGQFVTLRELSMDDLEDIWNYFEHEKPPFIESFFDTKEEAVEYLKRYISEVYDFYGYGLWGVFDNFSGEFAGIVGFTPRENDKDYIENGCEVYMDLELGYGIREKFQRQGYAYEACRMAIAFADDNIEYDSVIVKIDPDNVAAKALAKKLGIIR